MILKLCLKIKFVSWQPCYYNLLTEEKNKKNHVFEVKYFENVLLRSISRNSL